MWQLQEEVANLPAEAQTDVISPFAMALQGSGSGGGVSGGGGPKSQLARSLKTIFEDISHNGYCYERIHNYIEISFCMPHSVHVGSGQSALLKSSHCFGVCIWI